MFSAMQNYNFQLFIKVYNSDHEVISKTVSRGILDVKNLETVIF